jgi:cell division protein FtsI (penicillin-binding protein 3)
VKILHTTSQLLDRFELLILGQDHVKNAGPKFDSRRFKVLFYATQCIFLGLLVRAAIIQLFPPSKEQLERIATKQYEQHLDIAPYRGPILDRNGHPFAISQKRPSIAVNPRVFRPTNLELKALSEALDMPKDKIRQIGAKEAYFSWLKRRIDPQVATAIENLSIDGLYFINEPTRTYPLGSSAAQIVGSVGSDNAGLLGLEHQFNALLQGKPTLVSPSKDARGRTILFSSDLAAPDLPGHTIQLTIDHVIQEIADDALKTGVQNARAKAGFAVVTDPHTGRILALANYPHFDPNSIGKIKVENTRNHALLDSFEPGSVMKPLVIAAAIDAKKTNPHEMHNCENGVYRAGGVVFRDDHPAGSLTTTDVIVRSSNIGAYKIADRLGKQGLSDALRGFGLSGQLPLPEIFPTITRGFISSPNTWRPIRFANIAFGQGMTTTGLELALAYGALANGGHVMKPQLIDRITSPSGEITYSSTPETVRTVISATTAKQVRQILGEVVTNPHGTGKKAETPWYTTGGKTGTTEKVDPRTKAYSADLRLSSFIGITPIADPYLVIYVVIDEPAARPAYGGLWAAPVFSQIAEKSLRYLNVAPDKDPTAPKGKLALKAESTASPSKPVKTAR